MHRLVCFLLLLKFAGVVSAHEGHADSFRAAFAHPLAGWDHLLAALLVGMLAARAADAQRFRIAGAFVGGTAAGLALGAWVGPALQLAAWIEPALASTVLLLGLAVAWMRALPVGAALVCVLLGLVHGAAHGGEVPSDAAAAAGLIAATALLHATGYRFACAADVRAAWLVRSGGAAAALIGLVAVAAPLA